MALLIKRTLAAALVALSATVRADVAAETDLKAAFIYNFIVLSTWPLDSPAVLRFCVTGTQSEAAAFRALSGKYAGERTVSVQGVASPERASECQVLFISSSESARLDAWLSAVARQPTLTISNQPDAAGAMVNLRSAGGRIVFDVNPRAAAAARIALSSQLIKLAASRQ
jgi:YfiR/HmsC-like